LREERMSEAAESDDDGARKAGGSRGWLIPLTWRPRSFVIYMNAHVGLAG
jgi:hypothetical protein